MATENVIQLRKQVLSSVSPLTGEVLREFQQHSDQEVESKPGLAAETFSSFHRLKFAERAEMMSRSATILEKEKKSLGRLMTEEMGKTFVSAVQEAEKCAFGCRFYAQNAEGFLATEAARSNAAQTF